MKTLKQIYDEVENFSEEDRVKYISKLWDEFSFLSKDKLINFQADWDGAVGTDAFFKAQAKQIKIRIDMEMSDIGKDIRIARNKDSLSWDTKIGD